MLCFVSQINEHKHFPRFANNKVKLVEMLLSWHTEVLLQNYVIDESASK